MKRILSFVIQFAYFCFSSCQLLNTTLLVESAYLHTLVGETQFRIRDYTTGVPFTVSFWMKVTAPNPFLVTQQPVMKFLTGYITNLTLVANSWSSTHWKLSDGEGLMSIFSTCESSANPFPEEQTCNSIAANWQIFVVEVNIGTSQVIYKFSYGVSMLANTTVRLFGIVSSDFYISLMGSTGSVLPMKVAISTLVLHHGVYTSLQPIANRFDLRFTVGNGWLLADFEPVLENDDEIIPDLLFNADYGYVFFDISARWNVTEKIVVGKTNRLHFNIWKRAILWDPAVLPRSPVELSYIFMLDFTVFAMYGYLDYLANDFTGLMHYATMIAYRRLNTTHNFFSYDLGYRTDNFNMDFNLSTISGTNKTMSQLGINVTGSTETTPAHSLTMVYLIVDCSALYTSVTLKASFSPNPKSIMTFIPVVYLPLVSSQIHF